MNINIFPDASTVAQEAAAFIAAEARSAIAQRGRFIIALSGGKTPWMMLKALAGERIPWESVHLFQVDERIAPRGSADRNLTHLQETLLSCVPLKADQIYAMPVEETDLGSATKKYARLIESIAGFPIIFDVIHLGLGADGHTASLIPEDPVLKVLDRDVAITGTYQHHQRMTLTYPAINRSRKILWVVTGADKVEALGHLINRESFIPAGTIDQQKATLFADQSAADELNKSLQRNFHLSLGIASDHGGFELKEELLRRLRFAGYLVTDFGASSLVSGDDYPDYVIPLARAVSQGTIARGIAVCGSGVGVSVCANKVSGVRAALIGDHFSAKQGVEDDHINILCLGGRTMGVEEAWDLTQTYLKSSYSHASRHLRRLTKVSSIS